MAIKIAINGFGRIGRLVLRNILKNHPNCEVVAINDLTSPKTLAYLLQYDSNYGTYERRIKADEKSILIDGTSKGKKIPVFSEPDPQNLPWKKLKVDIVLECTGRFRSKDEVEKHIKAGANFVIISAPSKDKDIPAYVLGVNEENFNPRKEKIVDMGSCTTNCLAPIADVLNKKFGIVFGFMTTVHSYTNDQRILDLIHDDLRRARAAALNMIPTTTGAAISIGKIIPELNGKLNGFSLRVPTPVVSFLDLVCQVKKKTTAEEINYVLKKASQTEKLKGILGVEDALVVSSDCKGNSYSAIVDSECTMAIGDLIKVCAWYDNEWAYACRLAEFAEFIANKAKDKK